MKAEIIGDEAVQAAEGLNMKNRIYRNVFAEAGYSQEKVREKTEKCFHEIFYGTDCFYYEAGSDMAYIEDTGNLDVRTEGISYGMMMCVQMDRKEEFDKLWKWAKTYMYMDSGVNKGYFAWSLSPEGIPNAEGPAPDGEEYFAMALFFASHRWGDGNGIFNYSKEARMILHTCLHKEEDGAGRNMWDKNNHLIRFVPELDFTDPSYHVPHFYELFGEWANEEDKPFWKEAAAASRKFLQRACHPVTGLSPEYSSFEGKPYTGYQNIFGRHDWYYSDAYRTAANIALDYEWFEKGRGSRWHTIIAGNLQRFFCETVEKNPFAIYSVEGEIVGESALHPVAVTATNAEAALAIDAPLSGNALRCVKEFWETPLRTGARRYYDNCLYFFAVLALGGNYRIY